MSTDSPIKGLALTTRRGEIVVIGNIRIHAEPNGTGKVRLVIDAPKEIKIVREFLGKRERKGEF